MVTLTAPSFCDEYCAPLVPGVGRASHSFECRQNVSLWNEDAAKRWNVVRTRLRQVFPGAEFFRVRETQRRGAVHYHVLVVGVPLLPLEFVQRVAVKAGFGEVCDVTPVWHVGGAVVYVSKLVGYVLKEADESAALQLGRVWSCSLGWRDAETWRPRLDSGSLRGAVFLHVAGWEVGHDCKSAGCFVSLSPWVFDDVLTKRERRERRRAGWASEEGAGRLAATARVVVA